MSTNSVKFSIGMVKHYFDFRGVIYDVDFEFNNSEEWYQSIPKAKDQKDQPFYHLLLKVMMLHTKRMYRAELMVDNSKEPLKHPLIEEIFV